MKKSLESCRNCKFNSCFREDECNECNLNTFLNFRGYEYKFILNDKLSSEFKELERLAEIGRAVEKALGVDYYESSVTNVKNLIEWYRESEV